MTEDKEKKNMADMIEKLIDADNTYTPENASEEAQKLLAIAAELKEAKPSPDPRFEELLARRIGQYKSSAAEKAAKGGISQNNRQIEKRSIFPGWMSLPRVAAVAAALVIGLGLIGLTGAIIRGGVPGGTLPKAGITVDSSKSSDADSRQKSTGMEASPGQTGNGEAVTGSADSAAESPISGSMSSTQDLPSTQRVIKTADYIVEVAPGEFDDKYDQVSSIASRYGGYVVSADARTNDEDLMRGTITIRVANTADNFSKAQEDIDALGHVASRKVSGQDVTEEYVDLQSRLRNYEAQEAQMLALMARAQTIEEILTVQSRLSEVQAQIEQIKGRMKYMESRTDFATISVELRETKEGEEQHDDGANWGFVDSITYAGWLAVQTFNFVIMALGVILPLMLMAFGAYLLVYRLVLWRRHRTGA